MNNEQIETLARSLGIDILYEPMDAFTVGLGIGRVTERKACSIVAEEYDNGTNEHHGQRIALRILARGDQ